MLKKNIVWLTVFLIAAIVLSSCSAFGAEQPTVAPTSTAVPGVATATRAPGAATATPVVGVATATRPAAATPNVAPVLPGVQRNQFQGQTVSVLATWAGDELDSFNAMVAPWAAYTGATVGYEGTRDLNAVLTTRVSGGNPPDIAGLPGPAALLQYATSNDLVALNTFMDMDALADLYDQGWLDLASVNNNLYGLFTKAAVKSLIWYSPPDFQAKGYAVPKTWDELLTLTQNIAQSGTTPWCIGLESAQTSGWPATDWIEDIMLRTASPEIYDQWWRHEIPWTHAAVKNAWTLFGQIATNPQYVNGGITGELATNFGESPFPMLQDPPGCYMHRQATFISDFIKNQFPTTQAGRDYAYFQFPPINAQYGSPMLSSGDLFGMFNDTPAARSLMTWLASAPAQEIWARRGGFISPNRDVASSVYPDSLIADAAELLTNADVVRFDASDLMPAAVNDAFLAGILNYVQNPNQLDAILQQIEQVAVQAYANR